VLPCGLSDLPNVNKVKLYCPSCEDLYNPKSSKHGSIDGAYFGTTFQNILMQVYPNYAQQKSTARYEPRVFGFKVHAPAALQRWQEGRRTEMVARLQEAGIESPFIEDDDAMDEDNDDDGPDAPDEGIM
jgi:casein kinase II subunit beta